MTRPISPPITRPITDDDLHAHVDGALAPERRAEVAAYLDAHPDVARRFAGYDRQRAALRDALSPIADEPLPPELHLGRLLDARRPARRATWQLAVAAVVLVVLGGAAGWALRGAPAAGSLAGIGALAQEATDSYRVYAVDRVRPVELRAAQQQDLIAWVSDRLRHPIAIPDLSRDGYRFLGGRVVATPHGAAGLLMYDDDGGTRLVVLIRPMAIDRDTRMSPHADGELYGYTWATGGIGYSVVAQTAPDALHSLADEVRRQLRV